MTRCTGSSVSISRSTCSSRRYVWGMLHLDFGTALTTGKPVMEDIARVFPATIELATLAIIIGVGLGVPLGVLAAVYRGSVDRPYRRASSG